MRIILTAAVAAALLAPAAAFADLYRYETEQGTVAFTDDLERVPARYRASADRLESRELASYSRLTVVPRGATYAPVEPFEVEEAEAAGESESEAAVAEPRPSVELGLGASDALELPLDSDKPITVRRNQWRYVVEEGLGYLKPFTVIEQDGEVIAEIEPH
jgi:hypothetical protein